MARTKKIQDKSEKPKSKTLFDHVNQIRNVKNPNYFDELSNEDKKSFNHFMICRFLSMDVSCIYEIAYLSKIFDKMDSNSFYKVACALTSPVKYTPYVKSKYKKLNKTLIQHVSNKYVVSKSDASDYCEILMKDDGGINHLYEICQGYGMTDKEIESIMSRGNEDEK